MSGFRLKQKRGVRIWNRYSRKGGNGNEGWQRPTPLSESTSAPPEAGEVEFSISYLEWSSNDDKWLLDIGLFTFWQQMCEFYIPK